MDWNHTQLITKIDNSRRSFNYTLSFLTILIKLRYLNKGGKIGQHALKGNVVSFAQDLESAIKLLDILSLESLSDIVVVHFVGSSHPPIESIKMCKLLYV
jgi:hypothetical protein